MPLSPALFLAPALRLGVVATAAVLAGCGNLPGRDDLAGPPGATYQSSKSPAAYAQCLTPKWQATTVVGGSAAVESVPGAGGSLRMTLKVAGGVSRVIEVAPQGSGSTIRYWNRSNDFGTGTPSSVKAIEDCR
jgi:hypothetical protein